MERPTLALRIGLLPQFYEPHWNTFWILGQVLEHGSLPLVGKVRNLGFDILEVNAPAVTRMNKADRDALKGAATEAGIGLTYSIGMTADMDLVSEDATKRRKGIAFLHDVARAMKFMGGTIMAGINYSSWPRRLLPGEEKRSPHGSCRRGRARSN